MLALMSPLKPCCTPTNTPSSFFWSNKIAFYLCEIQQLFHYQIAIDRLRNPDKGKGSDVLLIAVLNAYMASTFRPTGAELTENPIVGMIQELRGMARGEKKDSDATISETVEISLDNILGKKKSNDS